MFEVRWALLCTDVEFNEDGSGDLLSVTEEFHSPAIPFSMGQLAVVMGLQLLHSGTCYLGVRLRVAKTRQVVFQSDPQENFISVQADKEPLNWIYPVYIHNISLPAFGEYTVDILRDSRLVYSCTGTPFTCGRTRNSRPGDRGVTRSFCLRARYAVPLQGEVAETVGVRFHRSKRKQTSPLLNEEPALLAGSFFTDTGDQPHIKTLHWGDLPVVAKTILSRR